MKTEIVDLKKLCAYAYNRYIPFKSTLNIYVIIAAGVIMSVEDFVFNLFWKYHYLVGIHINLLLVSSATDSHQQRHSGPVEPVEEDYIFNKRLSIFIVFF